MLYIVKNLRTRPTHLTTHWVNIRGIMDHTLISSFYLFYLFFFQAGYLNPDLKMVDEGLSGNLDWNLQSSQNITPSRTLSILCILSERLKIWLETLKIMMKRRIILIWIWIKKALNTESENAWNQGNLRKRVIN